VAQIIVTPRAGQDVKEAISAFGLPDDTWTQISRSLKPLEGSPLSGSALKDAAPARFVLGPWSWMMLVYIYEESSDEVYVVAVLDARSATT